MTQFAQDMSNQAAGRDPGAGAPAEGPRVVHSRLDNGMEIVVIPNRRAPIITHMVWYKNGSADDPLCKSGIAHFLEHLMFKGTKNHPKGEFSQKIADFGGQENAFTSYDYTAYFQRMPAQHLRFVMEYEADRMVNLCFEDDIVAPERDVVLEERRMRTDNDPAAQLSESVMAALFTHHPYGLPIIGWRHEIETLGRADALAYYERFYTPENAILVIAGDVEPEEAERLAREIYGPIASRAKPPQRLRPQEPEQRAARLVTLSDAKVEQPSCERVYITPSVRTAAPGESEALEAMAHILGGGPTSRLYRALVLEQAKAVNAGAYYMAGAIDDTRLWVYATPADGVSLEELDAAMGQVIAQLAAEGPQPQELERTKTRLIAQAVYSQDSQSSLARWYGAALAIGGAVDDVAQWPKRIEAVSAADVQNVARKWLEQGRPVTGFLKCETADGRAQ